MKLFPVVLSGGSGTRLWPLSREALPKQLLPLVSEKSMLQETVTRLLGLPELAPVTVICNENHRFMVSEQFTAMQMTPLKIVLEPAGRNTAPAVAVAAILSLRANPEAILLVLPADHLIQDIQAFHQAVQQAEKLAEQGYLVTFGIVPGGAETCYGYIEQGSSIEGCPNAFRVSSFVEKPNLTSAQQFIDSGFFSGTAGCLCFVRIAILRSCNAIVQTFLRRVRWLSKADIRTWSSGALMPMHSCHAPMILSIMP